MVYASIYLSAQHKQNRRMVEALLLVPLSLSSAKLIGCVEKLHIQRMATFINKLQYLLVFRVNEQSDRFMETTTAVIEFSDPPSHAFPEIVVYEMLSTS